MGFHAKHFGKTVLDAVVFLLIGMVGTATCGFVAALTTRWLLGEEAGDRAVVLGMVFGTSALVAVGLLSTREFLLETDRIWPNMAGNRGWRRWLNVKITVAWLAVAIGSAKVHVVTMEEATARTVALAEAKAEARAVRAVADSYSRSVMTRR